MTLRAGLIDPGEPNTANSSQPGRCVEGQGQAHPGSTLQGPLWLSEEAEGSPDPVVEGLGGGRVEWVVWPLEVTAGGRVPCREEGKGWLAGLAVVCCCLCLV